MAFLHAIAYISNGHIIPGTCQPPLLIYEWLPPHERRTYFGSAVLQLCGFENVNRPSNLPCKRHPTCIYRNISLYCA